MKKQHPQPVEHFVLGLGAWLASGPSIPCYPASRRRRNVDRNRGGGWFRGIVGFVVYHETPEIPR